MPTNLLKQYNQHLEIIAMNEPQREKSLRGVFNRDIKDNEFFRFKNKKINPTTEDGLIPMDTLFRHLTTEVTDKKTRHRSFEWERSKRLHWVKFHIDEMKKDNVLVFSVEERNGNRTYIFDIDESYVIILEPLRNKDEYYLLTAYYVRGKDKQRKKFEKKYKKFRLPEIL